MESKLIDSKVETFRLSRWIRFLIFIIFWFIMLFNCSDGGVPSAASVRLKQDLGFNDREFGLYGSIVQLGRISGTFIVMVLLNFFNRKYLMVFAIFLKCSTFLIYLVTYNWWVIIVFRYLQGVSHVFPYVYFPSWVNQFGIQKFKAIMLSGMQTASPFGSVFGFSVTTFIGAEKWRYGFATLAFLIIPLNCILLFIPDRYFSGKVYLFKKPEGAEEARKEEEGKKSIYSVFELKKDIQTKKKQNVFCSLLDITFILITIARTVLMFIFMAVHFWLGDYYFNVLHVEDKLKKASTYTFISLAGPFIGSFIGGSVCQYFGGYEKKSSIFVLIAFSFLTCLSGAAVAEMTTLMGFVSALFCFFLFANCMMPILIGIAFASVPPEHGSTAYSVNSLLCTFMGNLPSTTIYGFLNEHFKETDNRMAMRIVMNYIWVNLLLLVVTACIKYSRGDKDTGRKSKTSRTSEVGAGMQSSTGENIDPTTATNALKEGETKKPVEEELQNLEENKQDEDQ